MPSAQVKYGVWALGAVLAAALFISLSSRHEGGRKALQPPVPAQQDIDKLREDVRRALSGDLSPSQAVMPPMQSPQTAPPASLRQKIQKLQDGMLRRQQEGRDSPLAVMTMQPFDALLKAGEFAQAEEVVDRTLKLLEQVPGDDSLEKKLSRAKQAMEKRMKSDVPPIRIILAMKKFQAAVKAGQTEQAESALDLALKRLESAPGEDPLEKKLLRVQQGIKDLELKGGDPGPIGMTMARLEPAVLAGDEGQVEATLDAALKLLEAGSPAPRSFP